MSWPSWLAAEARRREQAGLRRALAPHEADDGLVDLAGNDYLGLARHHEVIAAAASTLKEYGLGAASSRLVRGTTAVHAALEVALAKLLGCEAALVYSSGYLANLGAVRAMAHPGTLIASDAHNHASLVDGCRLARSGPSGASGSPGLSGASGASGASKRDGVEVVVVPHADPAALASVLAGGLVGGRPGLVVTESVFSVDGDLAPLARLYGARHGALFLVDDAHGLGVIGPHGAGGVVDAGLAGRSDVVVTATLSKALGAAGGVVAGPAEFIAHLVDAGRTFIYDTALPPAVAAGALAALKLLCGPAGDAARAELAERSVLACARLRAAGFDVATPAGGVISVPAPGPGEAVAWAAACRARGLAVGCFRPPSTPDGRSRLRLTLSAGVPRPEFDRALDLIISLAPPQDLGDHEVSRVDTPGNRNLSS